MIDGRRHIFYSSDFCFAQSAPEISRYRRWLPVDPTRQLRSVDMLPFHGVDHLLLEPPVREIVVDAVRPLRISAHALFESRFPRLAPRSPRFNRVHSTFHPSRALRSR